MDKSVDFRPEARRERLLVERLENETLVFDLETNEAHCLNPSATLLWEACDGQTSLPAIQKARAWSEGLVSFGLQKLAAAGLLVQPPPPNPGRRWALRRLGRVVALPVVLSLLVPNPAMAQTCRPNGLPCSASSQCCSGCCRSNGNPSGRNLCTNPGGGVQCY